MVFGTRFRSKYLLASVLVAAALFGCDDDDITGSSGGNAAPQAAGLTASTPRGVPVTVTLAATDADGGSLTFSISGAPQNGTLSEVTSTGGQSATVTYTPNPSFAGVDQFTFSASDGSRSASGTAVITVTNARPVANATSVVRGGNQSIEITVTGSDGDGDALSFRVGSAPAAGTLSAFTSLSSTSARVTYTPNSSSASGDVFTIVASDGAQDSQPAPVSISTDPAPGGPLGGTLTVSTSPGQSAQIQLVGNDPNGTGNLTFALVSGPSNGTLTGLLSGDQAQGSGQTTTTVSYTPNNGFLGMDMFRYTVSDGLSTSGPIEVKIQVSNQTPTANKTTASTSAGTPVTVVLSGIDPDGGSLTFAIDAGPSNGALGSVTVTSATTAEVLYTPDGGFSGTDLFTYTVSDAVSTSAPETATVTVSGPPPVVGSVSPSSAAAGTTDLTVTVTGSNFQDGATAQIGDLTVKSVTVVSPTQVEIVIDIPQARPGGLRSVGVFNSDGQASVLNDAFLVTQVSLAPIADAGPDREGGVGSAVTMDGSASFDPDAGPGALTYQWRLFDPMGSNRTALLTGATTTTPSFTPDKQGIWAAQLFVTDGAVDGTIDVALIRVGDVVPLTYLFHASGFGDRWFEYIDVSTPTVIAPPILMDASFDEVAAAVYDPGQGLVVTVSIGGIIKTVDLSTGAEVVLNSPGTRIKGLEFVGGTLYGVATNTGDLYEVDPVTGALTSLGVLTASGFGSLSGFNGLAFDATSGTLFAVAKSGPGGGGAGARHLVAIDPVAMTATNIALFATGGVANLATTSDGTLYAVTGDGSGSGERLWVVDKTTAGLTLHLVLGNGSDGEAITAVPSPPGM